MDGVSVEGEGDLREKFNANEHFLGLLEGKLTRRVFWGASVMKSHFCNPDGTIAVVAGYNKSNNQLKIRTATINKIVLIETIEQAEALAKEVLGG